VAERLGYQLDPAATRLVAKRHRLRSAERRPVVAILGLRGMRTDLLGRVRALNEAMGLEIRQDVDQGEAPRALLRRLWQEGVTGLILQPGPILERPEWADVDWSRFSVVKASRGRGSGSGRSRPRGCIHFSSH
jgi:hypothetical protein